MLKGDVSVDDRGKVSFVNDFNFEGVKRFYVVENHQKGFVRAWHGHKKEAKYVYVVTGAAIVASMTLDCEDRERFILSADKPSVLCIPPNHYNGFKTLTDDTKIIFFSTSTLEESLGDDIRMDAKEWGETWEIQER